MSQPTTKAEWLDFMGMWFDTPLVIATPTGSTLQERIYRTVRGHSAFINAGPILGALRSHPWVGAIQETVLAGGSPTFADVASRLSGDALTEFQNNSISLEPMIEAILEREIQ